MKEKVKEKEQSRKAPAAERAPMMVLARAMWIEHTEQGATQEDRKKRIAAWKSQSAEEKRSTMSYARRVLKRLELAGYSLARK